MNRSIDLTCFSSADCSRFLSQRNTTYRMARHLKYRELLNLIVFIGIAGHMPSAYSQQMSQGNYQQETRKGQVDNNMARAPEARGIWDVISGAFGAALDLAKKAAIQAQLNPTRKLNGNNVCYPKVGCFNSTNNMSLAIGGPQSPQDVNTTFYFFTENSKDLKDLLQENRTTVKPEETWTLENWTLNKMKEPLNTSKNLVVVTHGLTGSKRTPWMLPLVEAILANLHCTVMVVDWEKGANGSYTDAGVNTPMPGVQISLLLQKIIEATECKLGPDNITLVGFSMGAQVMGFAGRHFKKTTSMELARITGLDPAGYLFEKTNVTLSRHDARFVDVIHTQAGNIYNFKLGLEHSVGHVDFYPNGGSVQEGCPSEPVVGSPTFWDDFTCSHYRAPALYIESLNRSNCTFYSFHCKNWTDFESKECFLHFKPSEMGIMGYYSFEATGRGDQYLYTNSKPPYCRGNDTTPPGPRDQQKAN